MKGFRLVLAAAVSFAVAAFPYFSHAFHEGGVGYCEGCHALHGEGGGGSASLLQGADPSSTCLRCHGDAAGSAAVLSSTGDRYTPGGDFYWLKKTYAWSSSRGEGVSPGERHGHNVVASEFGMSPDGTLTAAPGGEYPSGSLSCISCHDPHGKTSGSEGGAIAVSGSYGESAPEGTSAGSYRLLGGAGYADGSGVVFAQEAPVARASADWRETDANHVAYGSGMSEWCANCHGALLDAAQTGKKHPAGSGARLSAAIAANYNSYVRTADLTGDRETAYLALVPFEVGTADVSLLDPSSRRGPDTEANVMCLTCHRAHASAFTSAGRWDFKAAFLAESHPGPDEGGSDSLHSYYGRDLVAELGPYQRSLCNKCHVKD
ncbi:MAG: hypothetical protein SCH98_10125 [Deferrisomatales bacterium]|nr:hypothetical protein [Deferrisomatales bacterium]